MRNNTYKQDKNFKDLQFSEGEFINELDGDIIESRTTTYYTQDEEYERFLDEESTFIPIAELAASEISFDGRTQFRIGNNLPNAE